MRDLPVRRLASTVLCASVLIGITGPIAVAADASREHDRAAFRAPVPAAEKEKLLAQVRNLGTAGSALDPVVDLLNQSLEKGKLPADEARRLGEAAKQAVRRAATDPKPAAPTAPAQATAPVRPSAPSQPPTTTQPTASAQPAAPATSTAATPTTASKPAAQAAASKPAAQAAATASATPTAPASPTASAKPAAPASPATTAKPAAPSVPATSPVATKPTKPSTTATPSAPASPSASAAPSAPAVPAAPAVSGVPAALTVKSAERHADIVSPLSSRDLADDALSALQTAIDNLVKAVTGQLDQLLSSATDVVSGLVDLLGPDLLGEDTSAPSVDSLPALPSLPAEPSQSATS